MFSAIRASGERPPSRSGAGVKPGPRHIVVYHGNCFDGFGAAWAAHRRLGDNAIYFAATHGAPVPDLPWNGAQVFILDFSWSREALEAIAARAECVVVLDHHKTAEAALAGLLPPLDQYDPVDLRLMARAYKLNLFALFDMHRSGAGLAWDWFNPGAQRPEMIDHIEDRDLWRFALPRTREIHAALSSLEFDFEQWTDFAVYCGHHRLRDNVISQGAAILRKHDRDVAQLVATLQRRVKIRGHDVWAANIPFLFTSDAGHLMAAGAPFAACYWDTPDGRVWSLRSDPNGADVAAIAQTFGGGGHKHAAGFTLPLSSPVMGCIQ